MAFGWILEITFCDEANNQFLSLGGAEWDTKRERDVNLRTIPRSGRDFNLILDICSPRGIEDDRLISPETAERLMGKPLPVLIEAARAALTDSTEAAPNA